MKARQLIAGMLFAVAAMASATAAEVCTVVVDASTGQFLVQRGECDRRVTPASTFKIPISLMGYDAGFLKDAHQPMLPFRPGYVDWRESWKHPTDPSRWMNDSVVWYSQQVTRSLGMERFAAYVRKFEYGNADVRGDAEHDGLTLSWIGSSLRISPLEQASFLARFVNRRLGVSAHAYEMTEKLTEFGSLSGGWKVHGKYGSSSGWGWYVGWASKGARTLVFARLIQKDDSQPKDVLTGPWARDGFLAEFPHLTGSAR
ncbi:MAG: class D beta-lactamase [Janthinobacterium lividum]